MGRRKTRPDETPNRPAALRAYDEVGNVRPADDRYLNEDQALAKDLYVDEVGDELASPDELTIEDVGERTAAIAAGALEPETVTEPALESEFRNETGKA